MYMSGYDFIDMYLWCGKDDVKGRGGKKIFPHTFSAGSQTIAQLSSFSEMSKTPKEARAADTKAGPVL